MNLGLEDINRREYESMEEVKEELSPEAEVDLYYEDDFKVLEVKTDQDMSDELDLISIVLGADIYSKIRDPETNIYQIKDSF